MAGALEVEVSSYYFKNRNSLIHRHRNNEREPPTRLSHILFKINYITHLFLW